MPRTLFDSRPCEEVAGGYTCAVEAKEASGRAPIYRVELNGRGCWTARPTGPVPRDEREPASGCITLLDYLL